MSTRRAQVLTPPHVFNTTIFFFNAKGSSNGLQGCNAPVQGVDDASRGEDEHPPRVHQDVHRWQRVRRALRAYLRWYAKVFKQVGQSFEAMAMSPSTPRNTRGTGRDDRSPTGDTPYKKVTVLYTCCMYYQYTVKLTNGAS